MVSVNTTIYEVTPFEFGSWDNGLSAFAPLRYLGSKFTGGILPQNESCVRGFDSAAFVMGTSSSLFNTLITRSNGTSAPSVLTSAVSGLLTSLGESNSDIAQWPNPFVGFQNDSNVSAGTKTLTLVDGGEDGENVPLEPLLQPDRRVDVIFALDSSADTIESKWPNGTSLAASYDRSKVVWKDMGIGFPSIPDSNTFINLGLNTRPTFFGCDSKNITANKNGAAPLIVYIPNFPYVYASNISTFQLAYNATQRDAIIQNGYAVATMGNATHDSTWPVCVGCAILARSFERTGTKMPAACQDCMKTHCWDGTVNTTRPASFYPDLVGTKINVASSAVRFAPPAFAYVAAIFAVFWVWV